LYSERISFSEIRPELELFLALNQCFAA